MRNNSVLLMKRINITFCVIKEIHIFYYLDIESFFIQGLINIDEN